MSTSTRLKEAIRNHTHWVGYKDRQPLGYKTSQLIHFWKTVLMGHILILLDLFLTETVGCSTSINVRFLVHCVPDTNDNQLMMVPTK